MDPEGTVIPKLMSMPGELRLTAGGRWLHGDDEVTHEGIAQFFSRHLVYAPELAAFVITVDGRSVAVTVEDTPWMVRTLDAQAMPWRAHLSDGTIDEIPDPVLIARTGGAFYVPVRRGKHLARLSRQAADSLAPLVESSGAGGFRVLCGGTAVPVIVAG